MVARRHKYIIPPPARDSRTTLERAIRTARSDGREVLLTTHEHADADGIATTIAVQEIFRQRRIPARIVLGERLRAVGSLIEALELDFIEWKDMPERDTRLVALLDTRSGAMINGAVRRESEIFLVVDHHQESDSDLKAQHMIIDESAASTAQMIASLVPIGRLTGRVAFALAAGIASDTEGGRIREEDKRTRSCFEQLVAKAGVPKERIIELGFFVSPEMRIMAQKDAKTARVWRRRGYTVAVAQSHDDSPALLANTLRDQEIDLETGRADLSVAYSIRATDVLVSIRVSERARKTGLYANKVAREVTVKCKLPREKWGGGHTDKGGACVPVTQFGIDRVQEAVATMIDWVVGKTI
jgi:nanoRNase/pAp phosphatase (c-di-AMP/oligoRNAs hydrolase)